MVDDNRDAATTMSMTLKILGHDVRTAHDGFAAVEVAEEYQPNIIFMDVGMPRLNGYDATRRIREQPWGRQMLIVALTGWGQESDHLLSKDAGCDVHLLKPVELKDLQRVLAQNTPPAAADA